MQPLLLRGNLTCVSLPLEADVNMHRAGHELQSVWHEGAMGQPGPQSVVALLVESCSAFYVRLY